LPARRKQALHHTGNANKGGHKSTARRCSPTKNPIINVTVPFRARF